MWRRLVTACVLGVGLVGSFASGQALAQPGFVEFYVHQGTGTHFLYAPGSVSRTGAFARVRWTSPGRPYQVIYLVQIDCVNRTIVNVSVDRLNGDTGAFIETIDLQGRAPPDPIRPNTMGDYLSRRAC